MLTNPGHAEDSIVRVFQSGDDEWGRGWVSVESEVDIKGRTARGAVKTQNGTLGGSGIVKESQ
jgi:hypothetical protein